MKMLEIPTMEPGTLVLFGTRPVLTICNHEGPTCAVMTRSVVLVLLISPNMNNERVMSCTYYKSDQRRLPAWPL